MWQERGRNADSKTAQSDSDKIFGNLRQIGFRFAVFSISAYDLALALSSNFCCKGDPAEFLPLFSTSSLSRGFMVLSLPTCPGQALGAVNLRLCSSRVCFDHLRVIKRPLLPGAEPTRRKILFSWNILLNWNAWQLRNHCSHLNKSGCFS